MTILTWERFFSVSLHLRQGDALEGKAISLRRDDDCFTVTYDPEGASPSARQPCSPARSWRPKASPFPR